MQAHDAVSERMGEESPPPVTPSAGTLANVISYKAVGSQLSPEEAELQQLLTTPHMSALITAHDKVANKEYPLQIADGDDETDFPLTGPVKMVYVEKKDVPLVIKGRSIFPDFIDFRLCSI